MSADMKKMIAGAASHLWLETNVTRLTVKDIVEECHITRQSFYYYFADIPDMIRWILEQSTEHMLQEIQGAAGYRKRTPVFLSCCGKCRALYEKKAYRQIIKMRSSGFWSSISTIFLKW